MRMGKHESWKVATSKATAIAIATGIILYLALIAALPWHMDEYIMFHRLACLDSIQPFNNFEHSCFRPDLNRYVRLRRNRDKDRCRRVQGKQGLIA
jgi:hypothetical protein